MRDWLGLEPAKDRNVRRWDGSAGSAPITPVTEVKNAATRVHASSAIAGAPLTGMLTRKDLRVPKEETTMARIVSTESEKAARREKLRAYLASHGPTPRKALIEALSYPEGERGYYQLRTDCDAIGARSESRQSPVALPDSVGETPAPRRKPEPEAVVPVRPSLAEAAREALRQADREGAPLYLEAEFASALHGRLVEAGL